MALKTTLTYIKARLLEGSTYLGIAAAVTSAMAIEEPFTRHIIIITGILAAILPSPKASG
jgi:hypothetical protein